jgi:hypothetical protein
LPLALFIKQDHAARAARRAKADAAVRAGYGAAQGRPGGGGAPDVKLALPTLSSLKRDATSLDPAVAAAAMGPVPPVPPVPGLCSAQVSIRAVGDCDGTPPLGSFAQNCQAVRGNHQAILQYLKDKGYDDVREFRNAGAQLIDGSSFFPEEVWAIR